ncbi:MAG TPA: hypothetical protein PLM22_01015 [Candidatus Sabulitectum sp.]|nr:hypothetical protein [Candidatus Sabulitectum sp.]HPJ27481.1 hypothetical protein [Candidatus Sabulitectum sp.]HPR21294.1 hypothetical protein [Candidatus Sabulitectum sp.]
MKLLMILVALPLAAMAATATCGWEGTDTILGSYGDIIASIDTDPVYSGSQSLKLEDNQASGTPQAFVAWITGLDDGDTVAASFWRYDVTPSAAPSCRIWGHWNDDPGDINGYDGSAGGQDDYGTGEGWGMAEYEWTVVDGHTGLVIEVRTYSVPGDIVWIDDLTVTAPDGATIMVPEDFVSLNRSTWAGIKTAF